MFKQFIAFWQDYAYPYRRQIVLAVLFNIALNLVVLIIPWLSRFLIDLVTATAQRVPPPEVPAYISFFLGKDLYPTNSLVILKFAALMLLVVCVQGVFIYAIRRYLRGAARRVGYDLRNYYFAHLQKLSISYFGREKTGDLMARAVNDINKVQRLVAEGVLWVSDIFTMLPFALTMLFWMNSRLAAISLAPMLLIPVVVLFLGRPLHRGYQRLQEKNAEISAHVQETLSGIRLVKAYTMENQQHRWLGKLSREYLANSMRVVFQHGILHSAVGMMVRLSMLLSLGVGVFFVTREVMTVGQVYAFGAYIGVLIWPAVAIGFVVDAIMQGMASLERINKVLDETPTIKDTSPLVRLPHMRGEIEFRGLSFAYLGSERMVLRDINVLIKPGQKVAIIGPTGSGKTTLVSLIPRVYEVGPGQLFIDGIDVTRIPLVELRRQIGFVAQEDFLFSESIKENIAFGVSRVDDREVERAADIAQLLENVKEFPDKFETLVGERGVTLSGGQKQRTVISRALIKDPRILVLDDAFSAVDTSTEERILSKLQRELKGRTSILISHRVSTVKGADLILVMEAGRIVERGRHNQLVRRGGLYAGMWEKQKLMEEVEAVS